MTVTNNIYQKQIKYHAFNADFPKLAEKLSVNRTDRHENLNPFLFRILFTVPATWQCVDHKNVVVPEAL
jgi:hypothetical protein